MICSFLSPISIQKFTCENDCVFVQTFFSNSNGSHVRMVQSLRRVSRASNRNFTFVERINNNNKKYFTIPINSSDFKFEPAQINPQNKYIKIISQPIVHRAKTNICEAYFLDLVPNGKRKT